MQILSINAQTKCEAGSHQDYNESAAERRSAGINSFGHVSAWQSKHLFLVGVRSPTDQLQVIALLPCQPQHLRMERISASNVEIPLQKSSAVKQMKIQRYLQKISTGISLVVLGLGFSSLGLLSFVNQPHAGLANVPCVESASCIAGSAASLLAGTTFPSPPAFIGDAATVDRELRSAENDLRQSQIHESCGHAVTYSVEQPGRGGLRSPGVLWIVRWVTLTVGADEVGRAF